MNFIGKSHFYSQASSFRAVKKGKIFTNVFFFTKKVAFVFSEVSKLHWTFYIFISIQRNILCIPKCDTMNTSQLLKMGHPSEPGSSKVNALSSVWNLWLIISIHGIKAWDCIFLPDTLITLHKNSWGKN